MRLYKQPLLIVGPLCIFFGFLSLILMVLLFMKPEDKGPQLVGQRIRFPIKAVERKEEPPISGLVGEKGVEERPLGSVIPDVVFKQRVLARDIKIKENVPERIPVGEERTTSEIQEKSIKEISQSHPITPDRVKLQRERGPIEATPTRTVEPAEKPIGLSFNEEMAEGKRAEKGEEKTAQRDMVGDEKAPSPAGASFPLIKSETAMTAQKSVPQPGQLKHTEDLKNPNALGETDAPTDLSDKGISGARLPIVSSSSIEGEERTVQPKLPTLIATEEEVRQFFVHYRDRYSERDRDGFLSLFSSKAVQNGKDGFDGIKKIYSGFFDQSKHLRYHMEDTRVEIHENFVEVRGRYEVDQILKKRGKKKIWRGDIRWILVVENGGLKIRYLNYRPQKSP
jgi:hypothetical protein